MKIIIIILIFFSVFQLQGQENKNTLVLSGILAHYDQIRKYGSAKVVPGYYQYPVDPGIEVLYLRKLNNNISMGTGISYQKGKIMDFIINTERFHFAEISVPFLLSSRLKFNERNGLLITSGLYGGKTILLKAESASSVYDWNEIPDFNLAWYSDDVFFLDIYFGAGYSYSFSQKQSNLTYAFCQIQGKHSLVKFFSKKITLWGKNKLRT